MTELSHDASRLIAASRSRYRLDARDKARIRRKLMQRIGFGVAAGSVITASAATAKAAPAALPLTWLVWGSTTAKLLGVFVLVGATTVGGVAAWSKQASKGIVPASRSPHASMVHAPTSTARALVEPAELRAPAVTPAPSSVRETVPETQLTAARARIAPPSPKRESNADSPLLRQAEAIRASRTALQHGDARTALESLQRAIPLGAGGDLEQEALYVRVSASCLQGQVAEARRYAEGLLARFPTSPLTAKVRASCAFAARSEP